jgi:DNA mismatch repair ATPase MutS
VAPSTALPIINGRLDLVEYMLADELLRKRIADLLRKSADAKRILQRFSLGRGDAEDLIALRRTVSITKQIASILAGQQQDLTGGSLRSTAADDAQAPGFGSAQRVLSSVAAVVGRFHLDGPLALADHIAAAIDEQGLETMHHTEEVEAAAVAEDAEADGSLAAQGLTAAPIDDRQRTDLKSSTIRSPDADTQDVWVMKRR